MFWLAFLGWLVLCFLSVESERGILAFLSSVVYGVILYFAFGVNLWDLAMHHKMLMLVGALAYFPIGAFWSFFRWYMFVHAKLEKYVEFKTDWLVSKGQTSFTEIPDNLKEEWGKHLENGTTTRENYGYNPVYVKDLITPPLVRDNKGRILRWIGYWPISAISWIGMDMLRNFCKMIYNRIANWLQSISNNIFESIKKDLPDKMR